MTVRDLLWALAELPDDVKDFQVVYQNDAFGIAEKFGPNEPPYWEIEFIGWDDRPDLPKHSVRLST